MAAHMIRCCCFGLQILLIIFVVQIASDDQNFSRTIKKIEFNPGCNISLCQNASSNGSHVNVIHVEARGPMDSLHYIASTVTTPVVIIARTVGEGAKLVVDWNRLLNGSNVADCVRLDQKVSYSEAMVITRMIEFNDTGDKANLTASNLTLSHPLGDFNWAKAELFSNDTAHLIVFNATWKLNTDKFKAKNGSLNIKVKVYGDTGRPDKLPRLATTPNMSQVEFELDNFTSTWNGSRFALEMVLMTNDKDDPTKLEVLNSIDDEHSPGVFEIVNWRLNNIQKSTYSGYMQWKPVCYLSRDRGRGTATRTKHYTLTNKPAREVRAMVPVGSVAVAFFGDQLSHMVMNATNVSFGLSQDKFYVGHNYTVWSVSLGYGTIPVDGLSLLVIVIIVAGLGLPVILMVVGGIFLALRRRNVRSQYQAIQ